MLQRQQFREHVMQTELEKAQRRAAGMYLSATCRNAMVATGSENPEYVRLLHEQCKGELPGGVGCLCHHHDVVEGEVVTGTVAIPGSVI